VQAQPKDAQPDGGPDQLKFSAGRRNVPYDGKDNFSVATAKSRSRNFTHRGKVAIATVVLSASACSSAGRCDEHHARQRYRTYPRDRRPQSHRRKSKDITWQFLLEAMTLTAWRPPSPSSL